MKAISIIVGLNGNLRQKMQKTGVEVSDKMQEKQELFVSKLKEGEAIQLIQYSLREVRKYNTLGRKFIIYTKKYVIGFYKLNKFDVDFIDQNYITISERSSEPARNKRMNASLNETSYFRQVQLDYFACIELLCLRNRLKN